MNNLHTFEEMIKCGVPSNYNFSINDHVSGEYPLQIPFHLDELTKVIKSVDLYYNIQKAEGSQSDTSDNITIFVDGTECIIVSDAVGTIDLTEYITAPGWHEIEVQSGTLIKLIAQLTIRTFVHLENSNIE